MNFTDKDGEFLRKYFPDRGWHFVISNIRTAPDATKYDLELQETIEKLLYLIYRRDYILIPVEHVYGRLLVLWSEGYLERTWVPVCNTLNAPCYRLTEKGELALAEYLKGKADGNR